jgi:exonuclease III
MPLPSENSDLSSKKSVVENLAYTESKSKQNPLQKTIWHWNVNGLKTMLKKDKFTDFLNLYKPSILCINETKVAPGELEMVQKHIDPFFKHSHFNCCTTRKNYSGVAIFHNE